MISQILATKSHMTQAWTKAGVRIPVTVLMAKDCVIVAMTNKEDRVLLGAGTKKLNNVNKPQKSQLVKAGISFGVRSLKEVTVDQETKAQLQAGTIINPSQVLTIGDIVKVSGVSKGKGFTGVVKRHGFAGGPRTHGQSDRERAPGSIGAGTTPGRVYKNKRMAGRSGNANVTTLSLTVVGLNDTTGEILLKGIVPGSINGMVTITKTGESAFDGLLNAQPAVENPVVEAAPEVTEAPVVEATPEVEAPAAEAKTE